MNLLIYYKDGRPPEYLDRVREITQSYGDGRVELSRRGDPEMAREKVAKIEVTDIYEE